MKKTIVTVAGFALLISSAVVSAQPRLDYVTSSAIEAFRKAKDIPAQNLPAPTVVEMPFTESRLERQTFLLISETTGKAVAASFRQEAFANKIPVSVQADTVFGDSAFLVDGNVQTSASFQVSDDSTKNVAVITLTTPAAITSSQFSLILDANVALPHHIEIRTPTRAGDTSEELMGNIIVAKRELQSTNILFPKTTSSYWQITLWYSQPLRITELQLNQEGLEITRSANIRFLAQPDISYVLYFDADRNVQMQTPEAGDLSSDKGVVRISESPTRANGEYVIADGDQDGIPDLNDNCIQLANADQVDVNTNGLGDACDDFDRDGVINSRDNCVNEPNRSQEDEDGDEKGDACDDDESRVTEKYPWLPWAGMGSAALVLIILFAFTAKSLRRKETV